MLIAVTAGLVLLKSSKQQKIPIVLSVVAIAISILIYFLIGNVDYADQPYLVLKQRENSLKKLSIEELIEKYERGLKQKDSPEARIILANMLAKIGRLEDAEKHFKIAYEMNNGKNPNITLLYVEVLMALNQSIISDKIKVLIDDALSKDIHNPRGLFYKGLYFAQQNDTKQAIKIWKNLLEQAKDKTYYQATLQNIQMVIADYHIDPATLGINNTSNTEITKDNLPMIEQMVKSLEKKVKKNPNDKALKERLDTVQKELKRIKHDLNQ